MTKSESKEKQGAEVAARRRPESTFARHLFWPFFSAALSKIARMAEPGEQVNQAIRLIRPLAILGPSDSSGQDDPLSAADPVRGLLVTDYAGDVLELMDRLGDTDERDYLTRLFLEEVLAVDLFPPKWIRSLVEQIIGEEERQNALFAWGMAMAVKPEAAAWTREIADQIDDLNQFEQVLRTAAVAKRLGAEGGGKESTTRQSDESLADGIESAGGRVRLWAELAKRLHRTEEAASERFFQWAESALGEMTEKTKEADTTPEANEAEGVEKDDALFYLFDSAAGVEFSRLKPYRKEFADPVAAIGALDRYARDRFSDASALLAPLSCDRELEEKAFFHALSQTLDSALASKPTPERGARLLFATAALYYRHGRKEEARDAIRRGLPLAAEVENSTSRATLYQKAIRVLDRAGEKKAATKILSLLTRATDAIEPEDLRGLLWRENLLAFLAVGATERTRSFLEKIPGIGDRAVYELAVFLRENDAASPRNATLADSLPPEAQEILDRLRTLPASEAAPALVKIERQLALNPFGTDDRKR